MENTKHKIRMVLLKYIFELFTGKTMYMYTYYETLVHILSRLEYIMDIHSVRKHMFTCTALVV